MYVHGTRGCLPQFELYDCSSNLVCYYNDNSPSPLLFPLPSSPTPLLPLHSTLGQRPPGIHLLWKKVWVYPFFSIEGDSLHRELQGVSARRCNKGLTIELGLVLGDLGAGSREQGFIADEMLSRSRGRTTSYDSSLEGTEV